MQVMAEQGDTLDAICYRYYGALAGALEAVLAANPRLAELGAILPTGTLVELPNQVEQAADTQMIQLWD
ncbi:MULTISPECIES: tail protein X [unclassified Serratia (in: enterobacteria)]|uniref:tail protein X n=1 Tax=unclassified Serratia (in: enterobacteria) TaxID=2647522 RepID=UPI003075F3D4